MHGRAEMIAGLLCLSSMPAHYKWWKFLIFLLKSRRLIPERALIFDRRKVAVFAANDRLLRWAESTPEPQQPFSFGISSKRRQFNNDIRCRGQQPEPIHPAAVGIIDSRIIGRCEHDSNAILFQMINHAEMPLTQFVKMLHARKSEQGIHYNKPRAYCPCLLSALAHQVGPLHALNALVR